MTERETSEVALKGYSLLRPIFLCGDFRHSGQPIFVQGALAKYALS